LSPFLGSRWERWRRLWKRTERLQKELGRERKVKQVGPFIFSQDSFLPGRSWPKVGQSRKVIDQYLPLIQRVTPEDIQRVARQYLIPDNRTVGTLIPLPPKPGQEPPVGSPGRDRIIR
jgi:zinc protease